MTYVGLQSYTKEDINQIVANPKINGVILGDILCSKRMFPFVGEELYDYMIYLKEHNIDVVYQTPMYATDRIFSDVINKIIYWHTKKLLNTVIVQDIGMISVLRKTSEGLDIVWGQMGYARTPVINVDTLKWYKEIGVSSIMCKTDIQSRYVRELGIAPIHLVGCIDYLTINRECYYMYEHNIYDGACKRGCMNKETSIIPGKNEITTTIDGYILGLNYLYEKNSLSNLKPDEKIFIYAENLADLDRIQESIKVTS